ncbi:hypothetical protein AAG570_000926 [Ranatra chinensis]|uniref:Uncharacterized protein n=1 Tax=Ranatra chinensis TaxID=642074 RepID=A0ABD0YYI1_9HEMI
MGDQSGHKTFMRNGNKAPRQASVAIARLRHGEIRSCPEQPQSKNLAHSKHPPNNKTFILSLKNGSQFDHEEYSPPPRYERSPGNYLSDNGALIELTWGDRCVAILLFGDAGGQAMFGIASIFLGPLNGVFALQIGKFLSPPRPFCPFPLDGFPSYPRGEIYLLYARCVRKKCRLQLEGKGKACRIIPKSGTLEKRRDLKSPGARCSREISSLEIKLETWCASLRTLVVTARGTRCPKVGTQPHEEITWPTSFNSGTRALCHGAVQAKGAAKDVGEAEDRLGNRLG